MKIIPKLLTGASPRSAQWTLFSCHHARIAGQKRGWLDESSTIPLPMWRWRSRRVSRSWSFDDTLGRTVWNHLLFSLHGLWRIMGTSLFDSICRPRPGIQEDDSMTWNRSIRFCTCGTRISRSANVTRPIWGQCCRLEREARGQKKWSDAQNKEWQQSTSAFQSDSLKI